jgi:hypothetical protein
VNTGTGKLIEPSQAVLTVRDDRGRLILHVASIARPNGGSNLQVNLVDLPRDFVCTVEWARE